MKKFNLTSLTSALLLSLTAHNVAANEQPAAADLVGKMYGGVHYSLNKPDEDRINGFNNDFEVGDGFGLEFGYRYSEDTEFRFSYTALTIEFEEATTFDDDGKALSIDALYFPNKANFYLLGGLNSLNILETELSANIGLGYRHYFSERFAAYTEAKAHYQFDNEFIDQSAQIGLIYFFGETKKTAPKAQKAELAPAAPKKATPIAVVEAPKDADQDGVLDQNDKCLSTPISDKVDASGCTIFTEETLSQRLLVNFDNNKAVVKAEYNSEIAKVAKFLTTYPHTNMTINGYTSTQGAAAYNLSLSQKRADAVVTVLVNDFNIDADRLTAVGHGETSLLNTANTKQAHEENRRIEANVSVTKRVKVTK